MSGCLGCPSMEMKVHCPACSRALRVPQTASGRKARCPGCKQVFTIPSPDELFDETVSTWIEDDVEEMMEESDQKWQEVASMRAYQEKHDRMSASTVDLHADRKAEAKKNGEDELSRLDADDPAPVEKATTSPSPTIATDSADSTILGKVVDDDPPIEKAYEPTGGPSKSGTATTVKPAAAPAAESATSASGGVALKDDDVFPTELHKNASYPHLTVKECSQAGVTFVFDSVFLEHRGFRVSMPIACAFIGDTDREKLVGRPLAFIDQSAAAIRNASEVEDKHATHLLAGQTPNDLIDIMGTIDSLPKPFKFPLPYYVSPDHTKESVKCVTERMSDDHVICYVTIPNHQVALQWLLHVNGTCGIEYALLQHEVSLLENVAWGALDETCRQRLAVWCPFASKERFQTYFSDADFGKKDRGLAGLVVTDSRLIYCKYHHRGHIPLDEPATIRIKTDDNFAHLTFESDTLGKTKLVKLHTVDIPNLQEVLELFPHIAIESK